MLEELHIKDFALIQEIRINFSSGLNLITGETGAGKSIILGALNLVLGSRATTDMIRGGARRASVTAVFQLGDEPSLKKVLEDHGLEDESDTLLLRREITMEGKGRSFVNSQQVPVSLLKTIGTHLVDIHGQNEHQNILNIDNHRVILDRYAGLTEQVAAYAKKYRIRGELKQKLTSVSLDEQEKNRRLEILNHEIAEIEGAQIENLQELGELEAREKVLDHAETLVKDLSEMHRILQGEEMGILTKLSYIDKTLEKDAAFDDSLGDILEPMQESYYQLSDVASMLRSKAESIQFSPEEVQQVKERLDLLQSLIRKYGPDLESVLAYLDKARNEQSGIELSSEEEKTLRSEIERLTQELIAEATAISSRRKETASRLEQAVQQELSDLGMGSNKIRISMKWQYTPDGELVTPEGDKRYVLQSAGVDIIEFMMESGGVLRPLRKIASGGEMSRIMLSLKKIIIASDPVSTMIFDEVDAGVGGGVAEAVGQKLASLAEGGGTKKAQVLVITHLHQVAGHSSSSTTHFKVSKDGAQGTRIYKLNTGERLQELARMIGGETITPSALEHARSLLERGGRSSR